MTQTHVRALTWAISLVGCAAAVVFPTTPPIAATAPEWIWHEKDGARSSAALVRKTFESREHRKATLRAVTDFANAEIILNGKTVARAESYGRLVEVDVTRSVRVGENVLAARGEAISGPAALGVSLTLLESEGAERRIVSDRSWLATGDAAPGWESTDYIPRNWGAARSYGALAPHPWGDGREDISITSFDDYNQWKQSLGGGPGTTPSKFFLKPGFGIHLVHAARKGEGSWVGMTIDPRGRLLIGREDRGILRLTLPGEPDKAIRVETVNDTLKECRGLLYAAGALYANANESKALYRLRDTTGDDRFDDAALLVPSTGGVGHGRNDLTLGPDGMLYVIHGDAVDLPVGIPRATSPFCQNRPSRKTREGYVYRMALDGSSRELVARGMRNPYGIDFNADGEMFTYDADAEYDMGAPWYRPTRVNHLVHGADFGWRGVTRSWPPYYPDHPDNAPHNLDIGKGSPTSVKFGYDSSFPSPYRQALFVLDWAYGRILAVHMAPRGASYAMSSETFLKGRPLNVTDIEFGLDGSMYLITGGRKTRSSLYRITYTGANEPANKRKAARRATQQERERQRVCAEARKLRRALERFHGRTEAHAVSFAWPHLASPDPWIRYAARTAIEHQPRNSWRERALAEQQPWGALVALMALARSRDPGERDPILARLDNFPLHSLPPREQEVALQTYALCLDPRPPRRLEDAIRRRIGDRLNKAFPAQTAAVNRPLSQLMAHLNIAQVVPKTLALVETTMEQRDLFHYLFVLRAVREGWSDDRRVAYFAALGHMDAFHGGAGMPTFVKTVREDARSALNAREKQLVQPFLAPKKSTTGSQPARDARKDFVREWTLEDFSETGDAAGGELSIARGREMFHAALCVRCHRVRGEGSAFGPDLTSVASRFSRRDLLDSIIRPSNVVAEKYRNVAVVTKDGSVVVGRVALHGDYRRSILRIVDDPLQPERVREIPKPDIVSYKLSAVSSMPEGLLNTLTKEEILDLLAYLEAGGKR